ncbi:MAG: autotransporter-associated beta strand repeat-containing protein [Verrucomicrobiota bacterium]
MWALVDTSLTIHVIDSQHWYYTRVDDNDKRFISGAMTSTPQANTNASFVGRGYDWSGEGWINKGDTYRLQNVTLITPRHFWAAAHYAPDQGSTVNFYNGTSLIQKTTGSGYISEASVGDGSNPDLYVGSFTTAVSNDSGVHVTRLLDISSNNYVGQKLFIVGSQSKSVDPEGRQNGELISTSHIGSFTTHNKNTPNEAGDIHATNQDGDTFVGGEQGDSGSGMFIPYKGELTLAGGMFYGTGTAGSPLWDGDPNHVDPSIRINAALAPTGYALRWTIYDVPEDAANTANVWSGTAVGNGNISGGSNWSKGTMEVNKPVVFDSSVANIQTAVNIDSNQSVRGMLFRSSTAANGFTFNGSGILSVDRTGIRNEETNTQTFNNQIKLLGSQNWEAANGNLIFNGAIDTGSDTTTRLALVVQGAKNTTINGAITGTGYLAKDESGTLILSGANTYSGDTFIHDGTIQVAMAHDNVLSVNSKINFDTSDSAVLDLNNTNQSVAEVRSTLDGTGKIIIGTGSLTTGNAGSNSTYAGSFEGSGTINKKGSADWKLTGSSTNFTGTINVQRGALMIANTSGSATGTATIHIAGGILSGTGRIAGNVILESNGYLYLGDHNKTGSAAIGTLTMDNGFTWNSGGRMVFDLGAGGNSDLLDLGGSVFDKGTGRTFQFTLVDAGVSTGTYTLVKFGSTDFLQSDFSYSSSLTGLNGYFTLSANDLEFTVTAVPEPSVLILSVLGFILFLGKRPSVK